MSLFGVDYSDARPGPAALVAAGVHFACRYVSPGPASKNLDEAEAKALSAAGIWIVTVFESTAGRTQLGYAAGVADARVAHAQAIACGMPPAAPIYFAADYDATGRTGEVTSYLDGAASVIGRARVGLYGGLAAVTAALDGGHATYAWQTYAWSGGIWDTRAHIQQYENDRYLNGAVDYDRAIKANFGQWRIGATPITHQEDDMPQGLLAEGTGAITPIAIPKGRYTTIGFGADNGLQGLAPAQIRVAVCHGAGAWHIAHVVVDSAQNMPVLALPDAANVVALSIRREDAGNVRVAWQIS